MANRRYKAVLERILSGRSDANIGFSDLTGLLHHLGFSIRIRGDNHIFWKNGVVEIINLQPKGAKAKPYQVRQVRGIPLRYKLGVADE
ncbi:MAG: type II toxin-antitoxin system HicA family toxin [Gammaproteobacteria bacterium]|nr:MAG: type II toxin-antitoxin system HicA family toxin [Gammaproteobacteria bacterium]